MKKIPVTEIQDGMVLAQPVTGSTGNVLMGPGTLLKAALGSRLNGWGIPSIWVESEESETPPTSDSASPSDSKGQIDRVFQGRLVNSAMKTIYTVILKYKGAFHDEP